MRLLLDARAETELTDFRGWTALHHCANRSNLEVSEMLLDYGTDDSARAHIAGCPLPCCCGRWLHCCFNWWCGPTPADLVSGDHIGAPPLQEVRCPCAFSCKPTGGSRLWLLVDLNSADSRSIVMTATVWTTDATKPKAVDVQRPSCSPPSSAVAMLCCTAALRCGPALP